MKSLKKEFGIFFLLILVACEKKTDVIIEPIEPVFGFFYQGEFKEEMAEAFWFADSVIVISTGTLQLAFDGVDLNSKELNWSSFSEAIVEGAYSSNISDTTSGTLQLIHLDEEQNLLSGTFDFTAFDSFSPDESVTVKNGTIESIPVYRLQDSFYKKKGYGIFQNRELAYRQVNIKSSSTDSIFRIELNHPTRMNFKIEIKESIQPGIYDLSNLTRAEFGLTLSTGISDFPLSCIAGCQVEIEEVDQMNHDISFTINGNFKLDSGEELIIRELWVR